MRMLTQEEMTQIAAGLDENLTDNNADSWGLLALNILLPVAAVGFGLLCLRDSNLI